MISGCVSLCGTNEDTEKVPLFYVPKYLIFGSQNLNLNLNLARTDRYIYMIEK